MQIHSRYSGNYLRPYGCIGASRPRLVDRTRSIAGSCRGDGLMGSGSVSVLFHRHGLLNRPCSSRISVLAQAAADIVTTNGSQRVQHETANGGRNADLGRSQSDGRLRKHHLKTPHTEPQDGQESSMELTDKEINRRKKISEANKGKVPWNKGKNMTEEMKAKISQRTYEAMQRPEVKARMKKANAQRAPHSEEVRKRIRQVLRQRADAARAIISEQTDLILDAMRDSEHDYERRISVQQDAKDIIGKLAWRLLHRDFDLMYDKWANNTDDFRTAVILRFKELEDRKVKKRRARVKKRDEHREINQKLRAAEKARSKLAQAEEKLESVEHTIEKIQVLKATLKDDPESLARVLEKENQTTEILGRLREQVQLLQQAMGPYQQQSMKGATGSPKLVENKSNSSVVYCSEKKESLQPNTPLTQVPWGRH